MGENIGVGGWWLAVGLGLCGLNKLDRDGLGELGELIWGGGLGCDGVGWGGNPSINSVPSFTHSVNLRK